MKLNSIVRQLMEDNKSKDILTINKQEVTLSLTQEPGKIYEVNARVTQITPAPFPIEYLLNLIPNKKIARATVNVKDQPDDITLTFREGINGTNYHLFYTQLLAHYNTMIAILDQNTNGVAGKLVPPITMHSLVDLQSFCKQSEIEIRATTGGNMYSSFSLSIAPFGEKIKTYVRLTEGNKNGLWKFRINELGKRLELI